MIINHIQVEKKSQLFQATSWTMFVTYLGKEKKDIG